MFFEVKNLSVDLSGKKIVKNVSFSVNKAENIALIGTNGAGKTTLLKALSYLLKYSGTISVDNKNLSETGTKERAKLIAYVSQQSEINEDFTVCQFLELSRYPYRKPWEKLSEEDKNAIETATNLTDTNQFAERKISSLSGGEKQRVLLAGAIAQESRILLFDEPLTYLVPVQRITISKIIRKVAENNKIVITVTHEINEALVFSDRIIALSDGELVFDGTPKEFLASNQLKTLYKSDFFTFGNIDNKKTLVFPVIENES